MSPDERNGVMWNQITNVSDVAAQPIQFPETKGKPSVQVLNTDPALGPALVRIVMEPGDVIARHYHDGETETVYVLEGVLIDEGTPYAAGTELNVKAKTHHGPHETKTGVTFLSMFTGKIDPADFKLSAGVE
jgi:anti-sigma factor ChrR (cupin superfamily)